MTFSIKEIADLAGVSTRTLRYYDELGLLEPAEIGANGYRYYDHANLLRLQQILFLRELDVPLKKIKEIMDQPDFNMVESLEQHRSSLEERAERLLTLIDTIDLTIAMLHGVVKMTEGELFMGFDETKYEEEVGERWGETEKFAESQKRWSSYTEDQKSAIKKEGARITARMVGELPDISPDDPEVQAAVGDYLAYLNQHFYECDADFLRSLADMWVEDPRFSLNYERIRPGGAAFAREAVQIYCDTQS